jgi:uncharacterized membrane protein YgcG
MNKNDNLIYNKDIINLFTNTFDNNECKGESYNWSNMKKYFTKLFDLLVNFDLNKKNRDEYIKYYIFTKISFVYYINYLEYTEHKDALNNDIDAFNNAFKYNLKIIHKIHLSCKYPLKILNILYPFFKNAKSYYNRDDETYSNICKTNKKYENILLQITGSCGNKEQIVNLITFNHNMVKNLDYNSYSEFYYKNIIDRKHYFNNNFIDFTNFVDNIPSYKEILSIDVDGCNDKESVKHVRISEIINFVLKYFPYLSCTKNDKNMYVISHIKNGGKIVIEKSTESINIIFQYNLNLFYLNNPELKDITFLKNTNNFIKIKYQNNIIKDLTTLLNTFYFITRSCKYIDHCANSIDEILNIEQHNYCFYDTFLYFLIFIQKDIIVNTYYKKFVIDVIKYYYLYSYYDYHFYNDVELVTMMNKNDTNKNKVFDKFCCNTKKLFKIPNDLLSYPPFFKIENSNDNVFLYSYDYPNYIKFYDMLYSISTVFKFNSTTVFDIINNFCSYKSQEEDSYGKGGDRSKGSDGSSYGKGGDGSNGGIGSDGSKGDDNESWKNENGRYGLSSDWSGDGEGMGEGSGSSGEEDSSGSDGGGGGGSSDGEEEGNGDGRNGSNKNNTFIELSDESSEDHILITEYN